MKCPVERKSPRGATAAGPPVTTVGAFTVAAISGLLPRLLLPAFRQFRRKSLSWAIFLFASEYFGRRGASSTDAERLRYSFGVIWWLTAMCFLSVVNPFPQTRQTTLSAPNALFTGTAGFNSPETTAPSSPSDPARFQ